ncbi:MAG: IclR family transcriptional regulator [Proteobacteria bacterium]|nr:IclR family transcriptional regulator [Pseudomonadota bacterium]
MTALSRGLDVLRAFHGSEQWLGNQEIASRSKLTKPTVSRLTYTLTRLGYLSYDSASRKYSVAVGVLSLVQPILKRVELRHLVRPLMQAYADKVNAAVGLGTADGLDALYLDVCRGAEAVTVRLDPGSRIDIATSAMGRALFAAMDAGAREDVLRRCKTRDPKNFKRIERGLLNAADDVLERGYCVSASDWSPDVNGVGVPLRLNQAGMVFALNCGGAAWTLPLRRLETEVGPGLVKLGEQIASSKLSLG